MKKFFAIDIGNSETNIALVKNFKIYKVHTVNTNDIKIKKKKFFLFRPFKISNKSAISSIISSVVPEINSNVKNLCKYFLNKKPFFVSNNKNIFDVKNNIKKKNEIGSDRLINSLAVKNNYRYPAIVIDFGTATTFDIIDNKGFYAGGLIAPGIKLSLEALHNKTSKLPLIKFNKNKRVIGIDTLSAMQSGLYWGYIGLVSFLIKKIKKKYNYKFFCVSTGGYSRIISKDIKEINKIDTNLTIKGLIEFFKLSYYE